MNINRVRTLLVLANVGLAGATGFTVYKNFQNKDVRKKATEIFVQDLEHDLAAARAAVRKDQTRVSIKDSDFLDLTGDKEKPPEPVAVESAPVSRMLNPLEELIKIVTISYEPDGGIATITKKAEVGPSAERSNFRVGDVIPFANDAVIVEIKPREVVFRNGDRLETLKVPDQLSVAPGGPSGGGASRPSDPGLRPFATYVESKKDSTNVTIKAGGDRALEREGESVLQGVVFSSTDAPKGGKALRVDKVPPNSVLAQHGVQDGDVLVSVDGKPMSTKSEVMDYARQNKNKQVFDVEILRRGNRVNKRVIIER